VGQARCAFLLNCGGVQFPLFVLILDHLVKGAVLYAKRSESEYVVFLLVEGKENSFQVFAVYIQYQELEFLIFLLIGQDVNFLIRHQKILHDGQIIGVNW